MYVYIYIYIYGIADREDIFSSSWTWQIEIQTENAF